MSFQKLIIMGRLTRDADVRQIPSGTSVCEFGVAADTGWGDNKKPMFIDVTVWGKSGEALRQHFNKGDGILLEGELSFEQWEDKNGGGKRSKHKLIAHKWSFPIGSSRPNDESAPDNQERESHVPPPTKNAESDSKWSQEIDEIPF